MKGLSVTLGDYHDSDYNVYRDHNNIGERFQLQTTKLG